MEKGTKWKVITLGLQISIIAAAFWYLFDQLILQGHLKETFRSLTMASQQEAFWTGAILVIVGMLANWSLEAVKWRFLISETEKISFLDSLESVFSGITVSFFTPNRVGEFVGRIFFLEKSDRIKAALISILGSMSQLMVTLMVGSVALVFFIKLFAPVESYLFIILVFLIVIFNFILLFVFFNANVVHTLLDRFGLSKRFKKISDVFDGFSPSDLAKVLGLSALRYLIFTIQFYLLLGIMDVKIPFLPAYMMIAMTYLVMSIPTFALAELGIRSAVSIYFIGILSGNNGGIVTASFVLYLVNVAFPAVLGGFFVFRFKFFRKTKAS